MKQSIPLILAVYFYFGVRVVCRKFPMCPQIAADQYLLRVCVFVRIFTTRLTLPIKFSVPAVNFIGGVKSWLGRLCIFCLCTAEAQCWDPGLQGQDAPLIQICSTHFFHYSGVGRFILFVAETACHNFLLKKQKAMLWWDLRDMLWVQM